MDHVVTYTVYIIHDDQHVLFRVSDRSSLIPLLLAS